MDAEDLLHDCLEAAFENRDAWRGRNLKSWLMTIMTNQSRNRFRRHRNSPDMVDIEAAEEIVSPEICEDPLARDMLEKAVKRLPEENRIVLILVVVEGYSYSEVASILRIPIGTVMSRLSRARKKLADSLEQKNVVLLRGHT